MHRLPSIFLASIILVATLFFFASGSVRAEQIRVVGVENQSKPTYSLQVTDAKALAGVKIKLAYPADSLQYVASAITGNTSGFLHVINDKLPGQLVVVMASAKGVSGPLIELLTLSFEQISDAKQDHPPVIEVTACQLMSDDLRELPCKIVATMVP